MMDFWKEELPAWNQRFCPLEGSKTSPTEEEEREMV